MTDPATTDPAAPPAQADPLALVRAGARPEAPRRFYAAATTEPREGAHALLLDGRPARTPRRRPLALPTAAAGALVAAEWAAQGERIDPATMPATRIANSAIDGVADDPAAARDAVAAYAASDLVCYRAGAPEGLVALQARHWDPVLAFAREALGARFVLAEGVMPVAQPAPALDAVARALAPEADPLRLAALATLTTLAGSALIALALARGALDPDAAWAAAHADEDWEIAQWGEDEEASARRAARRREFDAAAALLAAVPAP